MSIYPGRTRPVRLRLTGPVALLITPTPVVSPGGGVIVDGSGSTGSTVPPKSPIAVLTFVSGGVAGETYTLTAAGTLDPDGTVASGTLHWGDSSTTTYNGPVSYTHVYEAAGSYTISLTVTDTTGRSATTTQTAVLTEVAPVDQPPVAGLSQVVTTVSVGVPATVSTAGTSDPDGQMVGGSITWGDGLQTTFTGAPSATYSHTYTTAGTKTVTLTVTDGSLSSTSTITIAVASLPPPPPLPITSWTLAWGDGTTQTGTGQPPTLQHIYAVAGGYTVTLTVVTIGPPPQSATTTTVIEVVGGNVTFTASPDHASVVSYEARLYVIGEDTPIDTIDLGKPAPVNDLITVDLSAFFADQPMGVYTLTIVAINGDGEAESLYSNDFSLPLP